MNRLQHLGRKELGKRVVEKETGFTRTTEQGLIKGLAFRCSQLQSKAGAK